MPSAIQPSLSRILLGIDAGGTFTDFVCVETDAEKEVSIRIHKTLSSPAAPEQAILRGIREMGLQAALDNGALHIVHGSTVATNAALEGKGARTAFVTNTGFADMLEIARQTRPALYALEPAPARVKVPRELCLEIEGRIAADGTQVEALSDEAIADLVQQLVALKPEAVAINLLFSFLAPAHEQRIEAAIERALPDALVSRSSRVLPEYKEYERGVATWLNASLGPVVYRYLSTLEKELSGNSLQIMQSSGETIAAAKASRTAVNLLLSGPAGGLTALHALGLQTGTSRFISFDMGGTSTDVALLDGAPVTTNEGTIAELPVGVPMVDMHTIGAGGGSIAALDTGGMLQVGPRSAGAVPGPVCYGQGGTQVTVTDAHVVLGRIDPSSTLAGGLTLDSAAALEALERLGAALGVDAKTAAEGALAVANEQIAAAIRLISVNRGYNPQDFTLTSFGGAGGLHVCALAEAMNMTRALVPIHGGVLSALGMIVAQPGRQLSRTATALLSDLTDAEIENGLAELEAQGRAELTAEGAQGPLAAKPSVDLRYKGQSYTLNVPWHSRAQAKQAFVALHRQRFGYDHDTELELVNLRSAVTAQGVELVLPRADSENTNRSTKSAANRVHSTHPASSAATDGSGAYPSIRREALDEHEREGPLVIIELAATTFVAPGWCAKRDAIGNIELRKR
jgi:N-methylhydantoinase A